MFLTPGAKPAPKWMPPPPRNRAALPSLPLPGLPGFPTPLALGVFWDEDWSVRGARAKGLHLPLALLH